MRRSRGYAPQPIRLPVACRRPTLALGGQLKATFALGRGRHAFLSHHLGDLDHYEAYPRLRRGDRALRATFRHRARAARPRPAPRLRLDAVRATSTPDARPTLAVQHHHAHMASCMAENGLDEPVIGVTFDGTGLRDRRHDLGRRVPGRAITAAFAGRPICARSRMPGGEQAIREPWRMAAAYLLDAGQDRLAPGEHGPRSPALRAVERMHRAAVQHAAHLQRGPALRCRRRPGRRPAIGSATRARRPSSWNGWRTDVAAGRRLSVRRSRRRPSGRPSRSSSTRGR